MRSSLLCPRTRLRAGVLVPVLATVFTAGCFNSPDMNNLKCTTSSHCPSGYVCVAQPGKNEGLCTKVVDGGGVEVVARVDDAAGIDEPRGLDATSSSEASAQAIDVPVPSMDSSPGLDVGSIVDSTPWPEVVADKPVSPDLGPDAAEDTGFVSTPDSAADRGPDTGYDTQLFVPDVSPDLAPDLPPPAPDLAPDLPPPAPDLGPDLPTTKPLGATCSQASDCSTNFCVSGICCDRSCTGACEQCTAAAGGQCTYKSGTQCLAATSCANAAVCSGSSATCPTPTLKPVGTVCGSATCSGSTQSGPTCNSAGSCVSGTKECYPFACVQGSGCNTSCTTNADCVSGNSSFCGKNGVCTVDAKCWHVTDGSSMLLWQVNPKEPSDPDNGPWDPQYHTYSNPGSTPDDVCNALTLCGFGDWKVPTISESRSLVRGCPSNVTGGACGVTDTCLGTSCDVGCTICDNLGGPGSLGCYWPEGINGPCNMYWSSSVYFDSGRGSYRYRQAGFADGSIGSCDASDGGFVRCVRHAQ